MRIFTILLCFITLGVSAQHEKYTIQGRVITSDNGEKQPLAGVFIRWQNKQVGVFTDSTGSFMLEHHHDSPYIVVSYLGYNSDTIEVENLNKELLIELTSTNELEGAVVLGKRFTYGLSRLDPRTTILLDEREFQKAACCNLSESFQNAPAIDVSFSDAVTGTRQIKMLGLDGFYTLIGKEFMPSVRTLDTYHGLSLIPAAWVNGIQITKGAGSVVNGYESIAGQINIELKKPFGKESFLLDQFVNEGGRAETDFMYRKDINKNLATSFFARAAFTPLENDRNGDGFLDMTTGRQYQFLNRWKYAHENGWEGMASISYLDDDHRGGQVTFNPNDSSNFGVNLNTKKTEAILKIGHAFKGREATSFGSQFMYTKTDYVSSYGNNLRGRVFDASSSTFYANLMFDSYIGNTNHKYTTGFSLLSDFVEESFDEYYFRRDEIVPGAFFEYTYKPKETFSVVAGIRSDYNSIFGWSVTPRLHSKYRFNKERTVIRLSAGLGRRTANPLAQFQQVFVSNRVLNIQGTDWSLPYGLQQESALNSGISFSHEFRLGYMPTTLGLDYFNTVFFNEVLLDRETARAATIYNVENGTRSNSFQTQLDVQPARRTDIRLAYRLFDVQSNYQNLGYLERPFISKHRGFINVTQSTRNHWQFSTTATWYGPQRIPGAYSLNEPLPLPPPVTEYAPSFMLWNLQVSKTFKKVFEVFVGGENLLNYRQENPIQEAANPFNENFDAGLVWGPIFGRMLYGGFRWRLSTK
jgi:outer membrane receptor for ferrienterochelin and colicins